VCWRFLGFALFSAAKELLCVPQDGAAEGHALVQDWLAILAAQYNRHILGLSGAAAAQVRRLIFESSN